jgi:lipoprotein-releasing system ATP-binding protein
MDEIISCKSVFKTYGTLPVLKGIDLTVNHGEIVAIVGPSGAGKTTLLHILGTLDSADKNINTALTVAGQKINELNPSDLATFRNEKLGFIFQFHELLPEFSALENVCMPGWIAGKDEKTLKAKAKGILEDLGLSDRIHHKPQQLSGGEQQRVAVARALINNPKVIFADEPSGNLDSHNAEELHRNFFRLRDQLGCTFVIVTHNETLANSADRKISLEDGKIKS